VLAGLYRGADEYLRASKALKDDFELRAAGAEQMVSDWTELNDAAAAAWSPRCVGALTTLPRSASPTLRRLEPEAPPAKEGSAPAEGSASAADGAASGDSPPVGAAGEVQAPAAASPSAAAQAAQAAQAQLLPPDEVQTLLATLPPRPDEVPTTALPPTPTPYPLPPTPYPLPPTPYPLPHPLPPKSSPQPQPRP
jgi:hypothetical protein